MATNPETGQVHLFGLDITNTDLHTAANAIVSAAESERPLSVGFVNAHLVNLISLDKVDRKTLNSFDLLFGDGAGIAMAARLTDTRLQDNVNGTDLFPILCELLAETHRSIFLYGGKPGIAKSAAAKASASSSVQVAGTADGYNYDDDTIVARVNESGASVLLVGLGMPLQEQWITKNISALKPMVVIAVGGLFDFVSQKNRRAPEAIRKLRLEWVWRLANEPRRLFGRYVIGVPRFLLQLRKSRVSHPVQAN